MRGEFVDLGGMRLYCYAAGSRGAGAPVVLIHGAFTSSHLWKDLLRRLPKGHRVLVLDLLGHGRSDPPYTTAMTVTAHAMRVKQLLDIMGVDRATVVGHGMGAAIALHLSHVAPERMAQMILVDPGFLSVARGGRTVSALHDPDDSGIRARLSGRLARLAFCEPLWRRVAPGLLASELHAAMLPAYARRDIGVRALDSFLVNYRSREGREAACAQLRALKRPNATGVPDVAVTPTPLSIAVTTGMLISPRSQRGVARLVERLRTITGTDIPVHQLSGVAYMAPEEAPDRLGAVISDVIDQYPCRHQAQKQHGS